MVAFEVSHDGRRVCLAGVGDDGGLHTAILYARGPGNGEEVSLRVGGFVRPSRDRLLWASSELAIGSEVRVRVVEVPEVDPPSKREQDDDISGIARFRRHLTGLCRSLSTDERRQLLEELVADLQAPDAGQDSPRGTGA